MSDKLQMWTVYKHPKDYPDDYLARLFEVDGSGAVATSKIVIGSLELLRQYLSEQGLVVLARNPEDDPVIIETWL